jgi:hypothetical protein
MKRNFSYEVVTNGEVVTSSKLKIEEEDNESKFVLEYVNGQTSGEFEFKREMDDDEDIIKINTKSTMVRPVNLEKPKFWLSPIRLPVIRRINTKSKRMIMMKLNWKKNAIMIPTKTTKTTTSTIPHFTYRNHYDQGQPWF